MKNQDVVIRAFDPATDIEKLSAIWLEASLIAHPFIGQKRIFEQRRLIEEKYLPNAETWVACLNDDPVGFISLMDTHIGGIFVAPDKQGEGIGRQLIALALDRKHELSLEVYTENESAFRFYLGLGFREVSRRPADDEGYPFENAHLQLNG